MAPASGSAERTGQIQAKRVKRTSLQIQAELANKAAFWLDYKAAHKAATREYAASVEQGMHRRKGRTSVDVATKYSKQLSPDSPHEITDRALTNWVAQGKVPGISPQVPGPKPCKVIWWPHCTAYGVCMTSLMHGLNACQVSATLGNVGTAKKVCLIPGNVMRSSEKSPEIPS